MPERIRAEQIKSIYRNASPGMVATLVAVAALTGLLVYLNVTGVSRAVLFISLMTLQTVARLILYRSYSKIERAPEDLRRWAVWFTMGVVAGGLTTGTGVIWLILNAHADLQLIALLLVFAVSSGAVGAYGAYLPAFNAFFVAISIAPVVWLFAQGDVIHITVGGLYMLWFVAVAEQARRSNQVFVDLVRLRFENVDLVKNLRLEKATAEQANAAKSGFLAAASHDLRQPVHALSLFVEAMRSRTMDEEARNLLEHIDGSIRAMGGLFGGLLDISRLDAGVVEVSKSSFPIQPLLERVCRDYESQARSKGIQLHLQRCSLWVRDVYKQRTHCGGMSSRQTSRHTGVGHRTRHC
jgi:signal transduction histidine kinase